MDSHLEVRLAESGAEALQALSTFEADVMMPVMDGPTLLGEIQKREGRQPAAIFITARVLPAEIAHFRAMGVAGVITKPFDPITLAAEVRRLVGEYSFT